MSFLSELEKEKCGKLDAAPDFWGEFDNEENLKEWYGCFCDNPFPAQCYLIEFHVFASDQTHQVKVTARSHELAMEAFIDKQRQAGKYEDAIAEYGDYKIEWVTLLDEEGNDIGETKMAEHTYYGVVLEK